MSDLVTSENDILNKLEQGEQIEVIVSSIPENKLKQMPLISLVIKMFKNNIS